MHFPKRYSALCGESQAHHCKTQGGTGEGVGERPGQRFAERQAWETGEVNRPGNCPLVTRQPFSAHTHQLSVLQTPFAFIC